MKKVLSIAAILTCIFFSAQQINFSGNYSTAKLKELKKDISAEARHDFYVQYFKAKIFEDMKAIFTYKNYDDQVLKSFTDSIFVTYADNEIRIENIDTEFKPSLTLQNHIDSYNKIVASWSEPVDNLKVFNDPKENEKMIKMFQETNKELLAEPRKTRLQLEAEYDSIIEEERKYFEESPTTFRGRNKILQRLDDELNKNVPSEDFVTLLENNFNPMLGIFTYFPAVSDEGYENTIYETIPGEILSYVYDDGYARNRVTTSYLINGKNIEVIDVYPSDENFTKKVARYAKKDWRFQERAGYGIEKNKSGEYVITTSVYAEQDAEEAPSYTIEYKTKDFNTFVPLRIGTNGEKSVWKMIR